MTAISFNKGDAMTMTAESARKMLASLLAKIQNGAAGDIGPADLDRLRAVASSSDHRIASTIPDLDRKYLRSGRGGSSSGPAIVRVVGMVKDQMDPEFYQERVANKSSKYRDYVYGANDAELELDPTNLAERQPLFVVPLPFSSQWFRDGMIIEEGRDGDASDAMQVEDVSGGEASEAVPKVPTLMATTMKICLQGVTGSFTRLAEIIVAGSFTNIVEALATGGPRVAWEVTLGRSQCLPRCTTTKIRQSKMEARRETAIYA